MHPIGYQALREKLNAEPGDLLVELNSDRSPMRPHLTNAMLHIERPDFVDLMLGVLSRAIGCKSSPTLRNQLYGFLSGSEFFRVVVHQKLLDRRFGTGDTAWPVMANYLSIAEGMVATVAEAWRVVHPVVLELLEQIKVWNETGWKAPADGQELLQRVIGGVKSAREQQQRLQERATMVARGVDLGPPPEDFRELSIFPAADDLKVKKPYLRANKIDGAYDDCEHYLDVQFRLLREDFMGPLRSGVSKYLDQVRLKQAIGRLQDIKLYYGVVILGAVASQSGLTYRIRFDTSKIKNIHRLMASKRLLYGALLCLSADNFETVYIATVQDKNPKDIVRGELEVIFEGPSAGHIQAIDYSTMDFTMVETTAYFESYRHVLEGLKDVKPADLPFQRYIVGCSCTGDNPPAYLRHLMFSYDLTCIAPPNLPMQSRFSLKHVLIQPHARWPTEADLGLDTSQLSALRLALSSEFAVIQGPPGTGKTYIGLKIVQVLLANLKAGLPSTLAQLNLRGPDPAANAPSHTASTSPILIVCYTNHALDQFLEGIFEYAAGGIVRVGGRSASEKMQQCAIAKLRDHRLISPVVRRRYAEVRGQVQERRNRTMVIARRMTMSDKGVLQFNVIEPFIQENHAWQLRPSDRNDFQGSPADFLNAWLDLAPLPCPPPGTVEDPSQLGEEQGRAVGGGEGGAAQGDGAVQAGPEGEAEEESSDDEAVETDETVFETKQRKLEDSDDENDGVTAMALQQLEAEEMAINFQELAAAQKAAPAALGAVGRAAGAAAPGAADGGWQVVGKKTSPKQLLKRLRTTKPMTPEEEQHVSSIWALKVNVRWRLYLTWVCRYRKNLSDKLVQESEGHDALVRELNELRMQGDIGILQRAKVIGMTTTGAARYRHVLQAVKPRIVVVEEAAEVLEAHIVTTLSSSCEHLILIGDHKQLRPNPTVYELAKTYKLDVSLFERMVQNKLPFRTLSTQHRMRPEISYVMRHIYENLLDHESVKQYDNIKGMKYNLFYIAHTEHEDHDDVLSSHSNNFEAQFVVALCRYLLQQGYTASQITILTPYTGQLLLLRQLMRERQATFDGVRVTSIDNYQGEENDIVLLSTVRSNNEGRVGFTNVSNRVCVALSRAKKGMYVFGNFEMLEKHSDLWRKILSDVAKSGKLGKQLPLVCQSHGRETSVGCGQDFAKVIDGGCSLQCAARLPCGHSCDRMCHPFDSDHELVECQKPCRRVFPICGHECTRACSADCGQCRTPVERELPCNHKQQMPCGADVRSQRCVAPCLRMLSCGRHRCSGRCGDPCPRMCVEKVEREYSCSHKNQVLCHQTEDDVPCQHPCNAELKCSHACKGTCGICKQGRLHKPCSEECKRPLVCGHLCEGQCCNGCPPCKKPCENRCPHSKCTKACGEPCVPCRELCSWRCTHHTCRRLCSEPCDRPRCDRPCSKRVRCQRCRREALCIGLCGEPCPVVCDRCDPARPYRQVFLGNEADADARFLQLEDCGHVVESTGMDHWMELEAAGSDRAEDGGAGSIQLKLCPICKTPVRRCVRYGVLVNAQLDDIEKVKAKIRRDERAVKQRFEAIKTEAVLSGLGGDLNASAASNRATANNVDILNFQLQCLKQVHRLTLLEPAISKDLLTVKKFVLALSDMLREQEVDDVEAELTRLDYQVLLAAAQRASRGGGLSPAPAELGRALLQAAQLLTGRLDSRKKALLKELEPVLRRYTGVSREEKNMIMQAMGFAQKGHWYKCPNGHIYCIGECGGASVEAKCPECKCVIGGTSHRLRDDNAVATEMDGATQPAFSEANNLNPLQFL